MYFGFHNYKLKCILTNEVISNVLNYFITLDINFNESLKITRSLK